LQQTERAHADWQRPVFVVTGGTGFIGSHIVQSAESSGRWRVRAVSRAVRSKVMTADIRDRGATAKALDGVDVLVHAASYIGDDPDRCEAINVRGTENVLSAAQLAGVQRIVYVSTAAVYGRGPFHLTEEDEVPISPVSALSASRASAERMILDAGGAVIRPHLVLGHGDRWVGTGVAALTRAVGGLIDGGRASHSIIDVETLADAIVGLASAPALERSVYHAGFRAPVSVEELVIELRGAGVDMPVAPVALEVAERSVSHSGQLQSALRLLTVDHTFDCSRLARDAAVDLDSPIQLSNAARSWYRTEISKS
jgi:2-alkyl-3-oxoalkanoate reductase